MYIKDSFTALDKLVDFAQKDAIQQQMTRSMNETIANMKIPGVDNPMSVTKKKLDEDTPSEN